MKITFTKIHNIRLLSVCLSMTILFTQFCFASGNVISKSATSPGEEEPVKRSKTKSFLSRNNNTIKIYPDAIKRMIHVIAKENHGNEIDFFVFDLQANLVKNYRMKEKEQVKITGLSRGIYVYRVFCGDEETASGKFEVK